MQRQLAPRIGVAASVATVVAIVAPYLAVDDAAVGVYYRQAIPVPTHLLVGLFALVAIVVFAAGSQNRTPPQTAAGATMVLGLFMTVIAVAWAVSVPADVVGSLDAPAVIQYHRWAVSIVALAVLATATWYARTVV